MEGNIVGKMPEDATHWDSGDWIEWHRTSAGIDNSCTLAAGDPMAQLTALHVNLLRSARGYFKITGNHLPVYHEIAHVHAALHCNLPLEGTDQASDAADVEVVHLPPYCSEDIVEVDLSKPFKMLVVVRINDNFTSEARILFRKDLPQGSENEHQIRWHEIPTTQTTLNQV